MRYIDTSKFSDEKFVSYFEKRVHSTIKKFKLLDNKKKIFVAASGGKDSTVLLYLMKKFGYDVNALTINAHIGCYSDTSLKNLKEFCKEQKIRLYDVSLRKEFGNSLCYIQSAMKEKGINKSSCSICGTLRRYLLNKYARKLKADILLTGHNLDDEADGMMLASSMNNFKLLARSGILISNNVFVPRAKPLYFVFENEVERYSKLHNFNVHYGWCPCSISGARRAFNEKNVSPKKKFDFIIKIMKEMSKLRKRFKSEKGISRCKICKEPTSNEICQVCKILSIIKINSTKMNRKQSEIKQGEAKLANVC